jgi:integrase
MSALSQALDDYLALRRALGARLVSTEFPLRRFVEFAESVGTDVVTTDLALRWATAPGGASLSTRAARLAHVRRFAAWLSAADPRTEVPPADLLPYRVLRKAPYLYSDQELARILEEAGRLASLSGLRALTYQTLFGLLAATGLRLSEALGLDCEDVDREGGLLVVRKGKFGKCRFVPLHETTCEALARYATRRDRIRPRPATPAFFLAERGVRVTASSAQYTFAVVSRAAGLRPPTLDNRHGRGPRLHDMRHRLAVATLVRWYREGKDVERELPRLSTYLGHAHVTDTYWYLEAVPELLQLASERAARPREVAP